MAISNYIFIFWTLSVTINLACCAPSDPEAEKTAFREKLAREMLSYMDQTADPCTDIYRYACGNFETVHPIPADAAKSSLFTGVSERVNVVLREIIEDIEDSSGEETSDSPEAKMKRFYDSCMDRETIDSRGIEPLTNFLEELRGSQNQSLEEFFAATNPFYAGNIIGAGIETDIERPTNVILSFQHQTFDTLSKSDLELGYNSSSTEAYLQTLISVLKLLGRSSDEAAMFAKQLIDFEMEILEIHPDPHASFRDSFDRIKFGEFVEMFPYFDWNEFLVKSIGYTLPADEEVFSETLQYVRKLGDLLQKTDPAFIKDWVLMKIAVSSIGYLDQSFLDIKAEQNKLLMGASKADPTWKTCVGYVTRDFDIAIGGMYALKYFGEESRSILQEVMRDVRQAFEDLILEKDWLQPSTKLLAIRKLDAIETFIGYDDDEVLPEAREEVYKDYSVNRDKFFENIMNIKKITWKKQAEKLGKPVKKESPFKPATVNAGLYLFHNSVSFPAAYLQEPTFHKYYPRAFIYAAIGSTMGHEIAHVFDDQGRQFNEKGEFKNWWDEASLEAYKEKTECFVEYYNKYTVHGHKVNGTISLGENMSDNSGLRAAFLAYRKWRKRNMNLSEGREDFLPGVRLDNYELFFLKYAQLWCDSIRPESTYVLLQDTHPPGEVRVRGVLGNSLEFADYFDCPLPQNVCIVW